MSLLTNKSAFRYRGIPDGQYQTEFDSMVRQGICLAGISGFGLGSLEEYTTIWGNASVDRPQADPVSLMWKADRQCDRKKQFRLMCATGCYTVALSISRVTGPYTSVN